ncbi:MAG: hypothetical protein ACRCTY_10435 [Candidatus Adiutrix sp.]
MQIANNNSYNTLGRLGPHYERPEYRPPQNNQGDVSDGLRALVKQDRSTLSTRNNDAPKAKKILGSVFTKPNLEQAQNLTASTSRLISQLPPYGTQKSPHLSTPKSIMAAFYV